MGWSAECGVRNNGDSRELSGECNVGYEEGAVECEVSSVMFKV